jgi:hypothetical protein
MMSSNLFARLRDLLPEAPLLVGTVLSVGTDGSSQVTLATELAQTQVAPGLARGATIRARGDSWPPGTRVFVRNGVIETKAPTGVAVAVTIGRRVAAPLGPPPIVSGSDLGGSAVVLSPSAVLGQPYVGTVLGAFNGGLRPLTCVIHAAAPPPGITMSPLGDLTGTPTIGGTAEWVVRATDTSGATVLSSVTLTVL